MNVANEQKSHCYIKCGYIFKICILFAYVFATPISSTGQIISKLELSQVILDDSVYFGSVKDLIFVNEDDIVLTDIIAEKIFRISLNKPRINAIKQPNEINPGVYQKPFGLVPVNDGYIVSLMSMPSYFYYNSDFSSGEFIDTKLLPSPIIGSNSGDLLHVIIYNPELSFSTLNLENGEIKTTNTRPDQPVANSFLNNMNVTQHGQKVYFTNSTEVDVKIFENGKETIIAIRDTLLHRINSLSLNDFVLQDISVSAISDLKLSRKYLYNYYENKIHPTKIILHEESIVYQMTFVNNNYIILFIDANSHEVTEIFYTEHRLMAISKAGQMAFIDITKIKEKGCQIWTGKISK